MVTARADLASVELKKCLALQANLLLVHFLCQPLKSPIFCLPLPRTVTYSLQCLGASVLQSAALPARHSTLIVQMAVCQRIGTRSLVKATACNSRCSCRSRNRRRSAVAAVTESETNKLGELLQKKSSCTNACHLMKAGHGK